jgi:hypothetical protein
VIKDFSIRRAVSRLSKITVMDLQAMSIKDLRDASRVTKIIIPALDAELARKQGSVQEAPEQRTPAV